MHIDIDNLTLEQSKVLNRLASEIRDEFNVMIGEGYEANSGRLGWLLGCVASRNPYMSPLFMRCCRIAMILEIWEGSQNKNIDIFCRDTALIACLRKHFRRVGADNITLSLTASWRERTKECIRPFFYLYSSFKHLFQRWMAARPVSDVDNLKHQPLVFLDVFLFAGNKGGGRIENRIYNDRYYPGLLDSLKKKGIKVRYLAALIGYDDVKKAFGEMRRCRTPFLVQDDFLKFKDFISLMMLPFRIASTRIHSMRFRSVDIDAMVSSDNRVRCGVWSSFQGLLNHLFIKRIAELGVKIEFLIDWNENQIVDRGLVLGIHQYMPQTPIIGYQGYIISPVHNFYIAPTRYEIEAGVAPDAMAVTGEALIQQARINVIDYEVFAAPAFRFDKVWRERQHQPKKDSFRILVGLPISWPEVQWMCLIVKEISKNLVAENLEFWLKPHPNYDNQKGIMLLSKFLEKNRIEIRTGDINDAIEQSHLFLGATSSTCVEALAKGLATIIIGNENGLTQNPIPEDLPKDMWRLCYGLEEIVNHITEIMEKDFSNFEGQCDTIRRRCFMPATEFNVSEFIMSCKDTIPFALRK